MFRMFLAMGLMCTMILLSGCTEPASAQSNQSQTQEQVQMVIEGAGCPPDGSLLLGDREIVTIQGHGMQCIVVDRLCGSPRPAVGCVLLGGGGPFEIISVE